MTEANYPYIAIGVGLIAIAIGGYYTFFMGCTNSVGVEKVAPAPARAKKDKETSEKPKYPNGPISIFFGSQTGTAEGFARTLMLEGRKAGFDCKTCDLEEFDPEVLASTKLAIFLMATYGEGEPTDNAQKFMAWLKNENGELASEFLANMKYVVFGLGNKQYEHFNRTGKQCDAGLKKLGAQPVYQYGEGDDDGTLEEDFDAWKENLWSGLTGGSIRAGAGDAEDAMETVSLTFDINVVDTANAKSDSIRDAAGTAARDASLRSSAKSTTSAANSKIPASLKHFFSSPRATVTTNRELRNLSFDKNGKEGVGSTRHIEINLHDVELTYFTADNLAVLPENESSVVEKLAKYMNYHLDDVVEFAGREAGFVAPYPSPCTVRELLTSYADIQGPVRHSLLKQLIAYVTDTDQKHWALYLAAPDQRAKFKEQIEEGHHSLVSLVTGPLSSARIPLADLLHMVNPIQPRYYTISSSSSYHPDTVHITVSVTETVTKAGHKHIGLCSGFLQRLAPNQGTVRVFVRASTFRLPKSLASPVLLVGPGTGLAPMRALLQERHFLLDQNKNNSANGKIGDCVLFFGCKYENMDFIYRDEIERFQSDGTLTNLYTAFSRDGDRKVYVQHLMTEDAARGKKLVQMLVEEGGSVYVCGATAMGADVMNAIIAILKTHQNLSTEDATAMVKKLQEKGRYVQELWTA